MTCDKITYASHKLAQEAAIALGLRKGKGMRSYKCRDCSGYHIATIRPKKKGTNLNVKYKYDNTKPLPKDIHIPKVSKRKCSQKSIPLATYKPFACLRDK